MAAAAARRSADSLYVGPHSSAVSLTFAIAEASFKGGMEMRAHPLFGVRGTVPSLRLSNLCQILSYFINRLLQLSQKWSSLDARFNGTCK